MTYCEDRLEALSAFFDGELTPGKRDELVSHLAVCPGCRAYLAQLQTLHDALVPETEEEDAPEGFAAGVLARLHTEGASGEIRQEKPAAKKPNPPKKHTRRGYYALAACAALVLLAAIPLSGIRMGGAAPQSSAAPAAGTEMTMEAPAAVEAPMEAAAEDTEFDMANEEALPDSFAREGDAGNTNSKAAATPSAGLIPDGDVPEAAETVEEAEEEVAFLTLSGEGAEDFLLSHGARPGNSSGEYRIDAEQLRALPDGLTLLGEGAERLDTLEGMVYVTLTGEGAGR